MSYGRLYWQDSEEEYAELVEERLEQVRASFALDADEIPTAWRDCSAGWNLARRLDRMSDDIIAYANDPTHPPRQFAADLRMIRDQRIRNVAEEARRARLGTALASALKSIKTQETANGQGSAKHAGAEDQSQPESAMYVDAEELLLTLLQLKIGYKRRHWDVERLLAVAALGFKAKGERARIYLTRAVQSYVLGRDDEAVVWIRACVGAELEHRLDEATDGLSEVSRLVALIDRCACLGILPGGAVDAAHNIRLAGNETLHVAPGLWHVPSVLRDLRTVLVALGGEQE